MALLLAYLAFTLVFSFLCSVLEAVILSVTPSYVAALKRVPGGAPDCCCIGSRRT